MKGLFPAFSFLLLTVLSPLSSAAPEWYVGYTFLYSESGHTCSFMRFRADSYSVEQADRLYPLLADRISRYAVINATLAHTLPSEALAKGETGEQMAQAFLTKGVGACLVAGQPVGGLLFISSFRCDYQNEAQLCIRLYVDTGAKDATGQGIDRGPAALGGIFVKREVWDASTALIYAGDTETPFAVDAALNYAASAIGLISP